MPSCWPSPARAIPILANSVWWEEGALADLLLVDGDPIANIKLIEYPEKNFVIIMKDGVVCVVYKNTAK